jgi:hypothetical protein
MAELTNFEVWVVFHPVDDRQEGRHGVMLWEFQIHHDPGATLSAHPVL